MLHLYDAFLISLLLAASKLCWKILGTVAITFLKLIAPTNLILMVSFQLDEVGLSFIFSASPQRLR